MDAIVNGNLSPAGEAHGWGFCGAQVAKNSSRSAFQADIDAYANLLCAYIFRIVRST